jgi:hypothetical protein
MRLSAAFFSGFVFCAACGPSATDACGAYAGVWCERHYTCATPSELSALQTKYGADVATCKTSYAAFNCGTGSQSPCPTGTSYDTGRQQQCTSEYGNLTCTDIESNTQLSDCSFDGFICH